MCIVADSVKKPKRTLEEEEKERESLRGKQSRLTCTGRRELRGEKGCKTDAELVLVGEFKNLQGSVAEL